jgi:urease accessory protein
VKAAARIVAEADGHGGTRLVELYGEAPLLPRRTGLLSAGPASAGPLSVGPLSAGPLSAGPASAGPLSAGPASAGLLSAGPAEVHLVGGAAGPLGGDDLHIDIRVGPGAHLSVRTVAATVALPGPGCSRSLVTATVAEDASLAWLPEPIVAARGCDHRAEARVELDGTARLHWREELVCGRHGESGGDLTLAMTIRRSGQPLFRHDLTVGPRAPWFSSPAVLGDARCVGTLVVVDATAFQPRVGEGFARMPLAGPGYVVTAVAPQAHLLRARLTP